MWSIFQKEKAYGRVLGFVFCGASFFRVCVLWSFPCLSFFFLRQFCFSCVFGPSSRMKWLLQGELVDCPSPLRFSVFFFFFWALFCQNLSLFFSFSCWSWFFGDCHDISAWSFIQQEYFFCSLKDFSKKFYWNQEWF
jgi:hypothetical protein